MNCGEIYKWNTDKAIGYDTRDKYHVFICDPQFPDEYVFLMINKSNWGQGYELSKADYPFFSLDVSFVGCEEIVSYEFDELPENLTECYQGRLTDIHLYELLTCVLDNRQMVRKHKNKVNQSIQAYLEAT